MLSSSPTPQAAVPELKLSARAAALVRRGAVLIRRGELAGAPPVGSDVVLLCDERGRVVGSGIYSAAGPYAVRILDRQAQVLSLELFAERIAAANARRQTLDDKRDAYRVVHGEADRLPGLFVDRYADAAVIQTATRAMDARKELIAEILSETLGVKRVFCRDDGSARDLEGLPRGKGVLRGDAAHSTVRFHDAFSLMEADLLHDRKTGSFLDQQENHALVADYAARLFSGRQARALDCFTYHGGFALALARAGLLVTACDEDGDAIARARRNAALNSATVDFKIANAFDLLRSLESTDARFEVVVIDPPALAKRGRGVTPDSAWQRAYKELFLRGMRLLSPGGLLAVCSCSGRVSVADFESLVASAGRDAGRMLQVLERRGAGRDHPVLLGWPESEYLKCWLLRAID